MFQCLKVEQELKGFDCFLGSYYFKNKTCVKMIIQLYYSHNLKGDDGNFTLLSNNKEQGGSARIYPLLLHGF